MRIAFGDIGTDLNINNIDNYIFDRKLIISSGGGSLFDGWAIHDYLKGKVDEIGVVGVCASAATIILLAAPIRWSTPNSRFMIHNPYTDVQGDATKVQQTANDLKIEQDILVNRYVEMTGIDAERIQNLMNKNIFLTPDEAKNINLISYIKQTTNMNDTQKEKLTFMEKAFKTILNLLHIKNMVVQDVNGNEMDFGSEVDAVEKIIVGVTATVSGAPANGEYVMADGSVYSFENGTLIEIKQPVTETEVDNLKTENKKLSDEIKDLLVKKETIEKEFSDFKNMAAEQIKSLQKDFNTFKNEFSTGKTVVNVPSKIEEKKQRKTINIK